MCEAAGVSPLKSPSTQRRFSMDRRFHTAKSKIFEVQDAASDLLTAASLLDNAPVTRSSEESNSLADDYLSLVENIKKKLSLCTTKNEEKALLTLLPRSWSIEKRKEVMGISHHMAYSSKLRLQVPTFSWENSMKKLDLVGT